MVLCDTHVPASSPVARLSVSGGYERMLTVVLFGSCAVGLAAAVA